MSNLYKSGFVAFSQQNTLVVDANKNHIIRQIEEKQQLELEAMEAEKERRAAMEEMGDMGEEDYVEGEEGLDEISFDDMSPSNLANVREQAGAIFEDARQAAEKVLEEARAEALILKEEAISEGREEGYQKGLEEAQSQLAAQEAELQEHFEGVRQQLELDYERELKEAEPMLVDVVCKILHKITGVMVENQHDVIVHLMERTLHDLEGTKSLTIRVSSDDYADVYSNMDWIRMQVDSNVEVELVEDTKLSKYQCFIDTENGLINCSLDEQLNNLMTSLRLLSEV